MKADCITVQVNRSMDGYHVLSRRWEGGMRDLGRLESEIVQEKTITESSDNPVLVKLALQQDRNGQGVYWTLKQITP